MLHWLATNDSINVIVYMKVDVRPNELGLLYEQHTSNAHDCLNVQQYDVKINNFVTTFKVKLRTYLFNKVYKVHVYTL